MAGVNRAPPPNGNHAVQRMRTYKRANAIATRVERMSEEEERQLRELDRDIVGLDPDEAARLRAQLDREDDDAGK